MNNTVIKMSVLLMIDLPALESHLNSGPHWNRNSDAGLGKLDGSRPSV
jgi:hypothetical protein